MDRNGTLNEAGAMPEESSRSGCEEVEDADKNRDNTSEDYVTTVGDSTSSLDTLGGGAEKKKGRFSALKRSFKKDGGLFKLKKKSDGSVRGGADVLMEAGADEENVKESNGKKTEKKKKEKKKSNSLVRKLSLNKFKLSSTDQEPRHTPEGGDSSRSQSQSSQESPSQSESGPRALRKGHDSEKIQMKRGIEEKPEKGGQKSEKLQDKPVSTVTVVQLKSPSLTIRSVSSVERLSTKHESENPERPSLTPEALDKVHCRISTLPYAISKWSESPDSSKPDSKKHKLAKSDSESAAAPKTPPTELRRKLSLLVEKRALFQRQRQDTSEDASEETLVAAFVEETGPANFGAPKRPARHISVRKYDTFSTFEGAFDEDTELGYLAGIEEDLETKFGVKSAKTDAMMDPKVEDASEQNRSSSQDSVSSQSNGPTTGLGEKREHLYKILVIGELGAGKTSIIKRYVHQFFSQHYRATIGVDFALKVLNWDPHTIIRLQLWDIAGQERFGNMTRVYYKEAVGAFIVFDVTRNATLDAVVKWKQDLDSKVQLPDGSPIPCVLLANKCDQQKEGLVNTPSKMNEYCKEKNFSGWFETSAKENINIEEAARFLVNKILQNDQIMKGNGSQDQTDGERFALNQPTANSKKSCFC